jgi:HEAT repeat protein
MPPNESPSHEPTRPPTDDSPSRPPSALDFVVRLLVVPALLVLAAVALWVVYRWLTLAPAMVDATVEQLSGEGRQRWRAAVHLAGMLNNPAYDHLRDDAALARRLADVLDDALATDRSDEESRALKVYLCRALGEFRTADAVPVLLEAASADRAAQHADVRRSAIEALAVLSDTLEPKTLAARGDVLEVLRRAADDKDPRVRAAAAFALGVWGGPRARETLRLMLADGRAAARYNAATGLARHGDPASVDVLLEMLAIEASHAGTSHSEEEDDARRLTGEVPADRPDQVVGPRQQTLIRLNALRAIEKLLGSADAPLPRKRLTAAVHRAAHEAEVPAVRAKAAEVLGQLR